MRAGSLCVLYLVSACGGASDVGDPLRTRVQHEAQDAGSDATNGAIDADAVGPSNDADAGAGVPLGAGTDQSEDAESRPRTNGDEPRGAGGATSPGQDVLDEASAGGASSAFGFGDGGVRPVSGGAGAPGVLPEPVACEQSASVDVGLPSTLVELGGQVEMQGLTEARTIIDPEPITVIDVAPGNTGIGVPFGTPATVVRFLSQAGDFVDGQLMLQGCGEPTKATTGTVLDVPAQYPDIASALSEATPGDTVRVAPGVYTERGLRLGAGVHLVGAGPDETILDGEGAAENLIDISGALQASIRGFRLTGVSEGGDCNGATEAPTRCSGDWYTAAIYGDGHESETAPEPCCDQTLVLIEGNVFEGNSTGVMLYYRSHALVRNNLFIANNNGLVVNHGGDAFVAAEYNVFLEHSVTAVAAAATHLHLMHNAIGDNAVGLHREYVQTGQERCNSFRGNATNVDDSRQRTVIGERGNWDFDIDGPPPAELELCFDEPPETIRWGSFAGPLGLEFD